MSASLPRVYYTCSYVPPELIWAAGCLPVRMLPVQPAPGECDAFLPRDFCPYVRAAFWSLYGGGAGPAAAVVLTTCCDPMRRLADLLRHRLPELPAFLIDLPREQGARGVEQLARQLERTYEHLRALPGTVPPRGGLEEASRLYGGVRTALARDRGSLGGAAFHHLVRRLFTSHPLDSVRCTGSGTTGAASPAAAGAAAPAAPHAAPPAAAPGVMVVTSHPVDPGALELIEQAGARIVAEDSCLGDRLLELPSEATGWRELAAAYLGRPPCPRMELPERRAIYLEDVARRRGAQGIVFLALKFCDNLGYDFPWMKRWSRLPLLFLEVDYRASTSGQLLTRVQAFVETLPVVSGS